MGGSADGSLHRLFRKLGERAKEFAQKLGRFDSGMRTLQNMPQQPAVSDAERLTVFRFGNIATSAGSPERRESPASTSRVRVGP
jgi:hypothetical protein